MESPPLMELPDIVQWARKVAKHWTGLQSGCLELGATPQYARVEVRTRRQPAGRTFSVNRLKAASRSNSRSSASSASGCARRRAGRACRSTTATGFKSSAGVRVVHHPGSLAVLFRSANHSGVGLINKLGYLAGYIQATKTPVRFPENG
jgi:hypothetical protein